MRLCLRCGITEDNPVHNRRLHPPEGWHRFCGIEYLEALEDALLFVREKAQAHEWKLTGIVINTYPDFSEKCCVVCGAINWGGKEDGICFGNHEGELAINAAHNRRAIAFMSPSYRIIKDTPIIPLDDYEP